VASTHLATRNVLRRETKQLVLKSLVAADVKTSTAALVGTRGFATKVKNGKAIDDFLPRHIGPREEDQREMLKVLGFNTLEEMTDAIVPNDIRSGGAELAKLPEPATESEALQELREIANKNRVLRTFIGQGYYGTRTPAPIMRHIIENAAWYTAYTPYQAEISQGRLEMLLNFQTVVSSITAMDIANCSLLDEGSSAAEAMNMCFAISKQKKPKFFVAEDCFPQTIGCVETRGLHMGVEIVVGDPASLLKDKNDTISQYCGVLVQYPNAFGTLEGSGTYADLAKALHAEGANLVVATDLLACTLAQPPGEFGADIVVGSAQRFGVPMFFGGPHAGFMSARDEYKRLMPGRIIGVSVDSQGKQALRMALQTREQFIRREKATSNICTAQALLANVAAAYAVYHGPEGIKRIANAVHSNAKGMKKALEVLGLRPEVETDFFDTLVYSHPTESGAIVEGACAEGVNLRDMGSGQFGLSVDETFEEKDAHAILRAVADVTEKHGKLEEAFKAFQDAAEDKMSIISKPRTSEFMQHPIFQKYHSETKLLRYLSALERRDVTLRESMIPLGSCTMKLNPTATLMPVSWPEFANMHPFCPPDQAQGYLEMIRQVNGWLCAITGFDALSTQPNSGATGEYAGLLCIKRYLESIGQGHRNICLIPNSAHGTNPASAVMCGMKVVGVKNDKHGNVDHEDFYEKVEKHGDNLAALMITYPSTYGKYERGVKELIQAVHDKGGQVYMDGANLNALLGITSPGFLGADVQHSNVHKTLTIPHGGGGPGVGPIGVKAHLAPFLPGNTVIPVGGEGDNVVPKKHDAVAAAPYGSAGILPIPWMFFKMVGREGMLDVSRVAMLNANYIAKKLENHYKVRFRENGLCAHEFILDLSHLKQYGLSETDIAKRLSDYGFHSPTTSWPLHFSLMVEPTESESKEECDRFIEAMIAIHDEIQEVIDGKADPKDNVLVNAPHTSEMIASEKWNHSYSRQKAAFPILAVNNLTKVWPVVSRVDNVAGDRNLICACPSVEELSE